MGVRSFFSGLVAMVAGVFACSSTPGAEQENEGWVLVWAEEFDLPGLPNPEVWRHEMGLVRNKEQQLYTDAEANCKIVDGKLVITARKERVSNPKYNPESTDWRAAEFADYTAASILTKRSFHYGRIEVRAKLPAGRGTWPAIWLLGTNISKIGWPRCGELDIMEYLGKDPKTIHSTVHYAGADGKHTMNGKSIDLKEPAAADFRVYSMDWDAQRVAFRVDGEQVHTFELDIAGVGAENPFRQPFYLLLNLALGGWGGEIDDSIFPVDYLVDYVRYYQKAGAKE